MAKFVLLVYTDIESMELLFDQDKNSFAGGCLLLGTFTCEGDFADILLPVLFVLLRY
jgi:hypothetical protein